MARAKVIYILIIKVNKLFSFFSSRCFLTEIENMYSVFLSSYTNTRESLGELEKAVETLAYGSCTHGISRSPKLPLVFVWPDRNTVHAFYFLIKTFNATFGATSKIDVHLSDSHLASVNKTRDTDKWHYTNRTITSLFYQYKYIYYYMFGVINMCSILHWDKITVVM